MSSDPASIDLLGGVDAACTDANSRRRYKIAYLTIGNSTDPCVIVPPGSAATKETNLFWAKELARMGPFFVVAYDLRGSGGSEPKDKWKDVFAAAGTTAEAEMKRVMGIKEGGGVDSDGHHFVSKKLEPEPLNPAISNELHDYDGYIEDAFAVMDELKIEKAHFMGLSQGGGLARMCAMRYPDRCLSCVSCASTMDKLGVMMGGMAEGAEEYYDQMKNANLFTKDGNMPFDTATVTKDEYVAWNSTLLEIIAPGFDKEVYHEMAAGQFDAGILDDHDVGVCTLAYECAERQGNFKKHIEALRNNKTVPIMFVHGKKDPVVHVQEAQRLFTATGNSVMELHDYGHNFGPPNQQTKLLGRIAHFMNRSIVQASASVPEAADIGKDVLVGEVSPELKAKHTTYSSVPALWEGFVSAQTAADTSFVLDVLLEKLELSHLHGQGLKLFMALKPALEKSGLQFRQKKLLNDLHASLLRAQKVVARERGKKPEAVNEVVQETIAKADSQEFKFNDILVCGAGPVGLRTACELALLGFRVTVIEKRPNFSRANILTLWDETMNDMLALGAKSYLPNLQPTGSQKIMGTRQIQVCLLKTLLLFGGTVRYGTEICGLRPPSSAGEKWLATFKPYVKHRRVAAVDEDAKRSAAEEEAAAPAEGAEDATDFQKAKDYGGKETASVEVWEVDQDYLNTPDAGDHGTPAAFDVYLIAEGGWSDSTRKLGFSKHVDVFKPVFGLVVNMVYDPSDLKQKNMKTQIHFALSKDWPLRNCLIAAEFVEYLKGETHFFALTVPKSHNQSERTEQRIADMKPEDRDAMPPEVIEQLRRWGNQKGLVEMGVFRKNFASGKACLASDNIDMERLHQMVREITQELGMSATAELFPTNPVQLFDFSRRARCVDPVRFLRASTSGSAPTVLSPKDYLDAPAPDDSIDALVFPVGDALQEPVWTQGTGINRGFHTGMNQAFACLLAREKGATAAVQESCKTYEVVKTMKWGMGNSGLAGSGSGNIGLKPFDKWDTDPRSRLPVK